MDPKNQKILEKAAVMEVLEGCIGIPNTVYCHPRFYAEQTWRYFENCKPPLIINKEFLNFQQFMDHFSTHSPVIYHLLDWIFQLNYLNIGDNTIPNIPAYQGTII